MAAAESTEGHFFLPKKTCINLLEVPRDLVAEWLRTLNTIIVDCDGVLWVYTHMIEGAMSTMNRLRALGKQIFLCTNNSGKSREEIRDKVASHGFAISKDNIMTAAFSAAHFLKSRYLKKKCFVIGNASIKNELEEHKLQCLEVGRDEFDCTVDEYVSKVIKLDEDVGAVIVGFDMHFSFAKMIKAASYLRDPKCFFLATNMDERFQFPDFVLPGTGAFVRAIETCAGREATVIGKPSRHMCQMHILNGKIKAKQTLIIGGNCSADILMGFNCGFQTLLVGTGTNTLNDLRAYRFSQNAEIKKLLPDFYLPSIIDLLQFL